MIPPPLRPSTDKSLLIATSDQATSSWVSALFKTPATVLDVFPIGTGQMSKTVRVLFKLDGSDEEESVVVKIASEDAGSQAVGFDYGAYERETVVYAELSETANKTKAIPFCYLAVFEPKGYFTLVLEDLKDSVQGNQLEGCTPAEALIALKALAKLQAPFLANEELLKKSPWLIKDFDASPHNDYTMYNACLPAFLERYKDLVSPEHAEFCSWLAPHVKAWLTDPPSTVLGLKHRDYRLDNILFPTTPDGRVVIVDFQGVCWGDAMEDASYFMGSSLLTEDRRACEKEVIREYVSELNGDGEEKITWDQAWLCYRRGAIFGVLQAVYASILCVRTPRGDIMFTTLLRRHAQQCLDLNFKDLFP